MFLTISYMHFNENVQKPLGTDRRIDGGIKSYHVEPVVIVSTLKTSPLWPWCFHDKGMEVLLRQCKSEWLDCSGFFWFKVYFQLRNAIDDIDQGMNKEIWGP